MSMIAIGLATVIGSLLLLLIAAAYIIQQYYDEKMGLLSDIRRMKEPPLPVLYNDYFEPDEIGHEGEEFAELEPVSSRQLRKFVEPTLKHSVVVANRILGNPCYRTDFTLVIETDKGTWMRAYDGDKTDPWHYSWSEDNKKFMLRLRWQTVHFGQDCEVLAAYFVCGDLVMRYIPDLNQMYAGDEFNIQYNFTSEDCFQWQNNDT